MECFREPPGLFFAKDRAMVASAMVREGGCRIQNGQKRGYGGMP